MKLQGKQRRNKWYYRMNKGEHEDMFDQSSYTLNLSSWEIKETWLLARLFMLQSSIISQILEFNYWIVTIVSFEHKIGQNPARILCLRGNIDLLASTNVSEPTVNWEFYFKSIKIRLMPYSHRGFSSQNLAMRLQFQIEIEGIKVWKQPIQTLQNLF